MIKTSRNSEASHDARFRRKKKKQMWRIRKIKEKSNFTFLKSQAIKEKMGELDPLKP